MRNFSDQQSKCLYYESCQNPRAQVNQLSPYFEPQKSALDKAGMLKSLLTAGGIYCLRIRFIFICALAILRTGFSEYKYISKFIYCEHSAKLFQ